MSFNELLLVVRSRSMRLSNQRFRFLKPRGAATGDDESWITFPTGAIQHEFTDQIVKEAEAVKNGTVDCFGVTRFANWPPDWNTDWTTGFVWENGTFYRDAVIIDPDSPCDVKVPWELSRFHHLIVLAKAYHLTGRSDFAHRIESDLVSWISQNPFCRTINWTSPLEVAIRAVNWLWAIKLCRKWFAARPELLKTVNRSLYLHGLFISSNLEINPVGYSSNHLFGNLVGLVYLGAYFQGDSRGAKWLRESKEKLYREVLTQFYSCGPHFELSIGYHRFVTEMMLSAICQLRRIGEVVPSEVLRRAENALEYVLHYTRPDGSAPMIGDCDDGRLHIMGDYLGWPRNDHRNLLALGQAIFGIHTRGEAIQPLYEEAMFLLDQPDLLQEKAIVPQEIETKGFSEAGIYIMRHRNNYLLVKTSNQGAYESAGWHTHNDVLSFDLTMEGVPLVVDPGVGNYSGSIEERNFFRSTRVHNTVMIEGTEQNTLWETPERLWSNGGEAKPCLEEWTSNSNRDTLRAHHRGYTRLKCRAIHRREFVFSKSARIVTIKDTFDGIGVFSAEWNFLLNPGIIPERLDSKHWLLRAEKSEFEVESDVPLEQRESWISPRYKYKVKTIQLSGELPVSSNSIVVTKFRGK